MGVSATLRLLAAIEKKGNGLLQARFVIIRQKIGVRLQPRFEAGGESAGLDVTREFRDGHEVFFGQFNVG